MQQVNAFINMVKSILDTIMNIRLKAVCLLFCQCLALLILFGIILTMVGVKFLDFASDQIFTYLTEDVKQNKKLFVINNDIINLMKSPLNITLQTEKFYKDSVYEDIRKIIQQKSSLDKLIFINGVQSIGKSTSSKVIANQLMKQGFPVLFFEFLYTSEEELPDKPLTLSQQKIGQHKILNFIFKWKNYSKMSDRIKHFNTLFQKNFKNKELFIFIDQINAVSPLCEDKCPKPIESFFKRLIEAQLKNKNTTVILLSSDPNFSYLDKITGFRQYNHALFYQVRSKTEQLEQMLNDYGIKSQKTKKYILKYLNSRGRIIGILKDAEFNYSLNNIKLIIEQYVNKGKKKFKQFLQEESRRKELQQCLIGICKQQNLNLVFQSDVKHLGAQNILFQYQFKSRFQMKVFERYAKEVLNQTLRCVEKGQKILARKKII